MNKKPIIVIVGPTASGKTALGIKLAQKVNGEIISADSRQVYRGLEIGTAKPSAAQLKKIPHHCIGIAEPDHIFDAGQFVHHANKAIIDITRRGKRPIIIGGTGLYIKALIDGLAPLPERDDAVRKNLTGEIHAKGLEHLFNRLQKLDPETAKILDRHNPARVIRAMEVYLLTGKGMALLHQQTKKSPFSYIMFGLNIPKEVLVKRIAARTSKMLKLGMITETKRLIDQGYNADCPALLGLGYRQTLAHIRGEIDKEELARLINTETRQYAKRQYTWFRKDKRITWLKPPFRVREIKLTGD